MANIGSPREVLRFVGIVFAGFWMFFAGVFFLIRGPHLSNTRLFLLTTVVSAVTTLCAFGMRWLAIKRFKKE